MKVLKRILNWTIWSIIALHVALFLCLQLPPVQRWIGGKVSAGLSKTLGTRVTVGSVGVGLSGRLIIDDACIPDLQGDTLLRVGRLSVKTALLPLLDGHIVITSAQLFGADVRLCQADSTSVPNYQFIIDALSTDKDTTESRPFDLHIGSLIVRRSSVSYERGPGGKTAGHTDSGENGGQADGGTEKRGGQAGEQPLHIAISDISTHITLKTLTADSVDINVKRLSLREQSGLSVEDFCTRLTANPHAAHLQGLRLQLPHSTIAIDTLTATTVGTFLRDSSQIHPHNILDSLRYAVTIGESTITPSDFEPLLSHLLPTMRNGSLPLPPFTFSTSFTGSPKALSCPHFQLLSSDGSLSLRASGSLDSNSPTVAWQLQLDQLDASAAIIATLKELIPSIPDELTRLGNIHLSGKALRQYDGQTDGHADIATGLGKASLLLTIDEHEQFSGHITTDSLHLGHLLAYDDLGSIAANITIGGTKEQMAAVCDVHRLHFKGHNYHDIAVNGSYQPPTGTLTATFNIDDPDLKATAEGTLASIGIAPLADFLDITCLSSPQKALRLTGHLSRLHPSALGLTDQWGDATFSASIDADLTGNTLTDVRGFLDLDDFTMRSATDSVLCLIDHLQVTSDMDGGQRKISLDSDIADGELTCLPDFAHLPKDFNLQLTVKETRWMQPLLGIPLTLRQPLLLTAAADSTDSNSIVTSMTWHTTSSTDDGQHATKSVINAVTQLYDNALGRPEVHIAVRPSQVVIGDAPWYIHPSHLAYTEDHLAVDSFAVSHGSLHLIIDGKASSTADDTLSIDMNGLDVAYIQDLLDFHPVDFNGQLSGKAFATSLFGIPSTWANMQVDEFRFQGGRMGTLYAKAAWNTAKSQIDIDAVADEKVEGRTLIAGYISPVRSDIDLKIRAEGSNIEFCHSFTDSFLSDISGRAHGMVELAGPLGDMNLTGLLTVDGQMTVEALNTTYKLKNDTILLVPDDIQLHNVIVHDRDGNTATLTGGIHHHTLSDFTFDINVAARNALVYDFPTFGDSNICGTVHATGNADIHVRPGEVTINCNVTPQSGSTFAYNAANPDAVSRQEFITWEEKTLPQPLPKGRRAVTSTVEDGNEESIYSPSYREGQGGGSLIINFLINATPEATLRLLMDANTGDYITLNGNGIIRATYHNKGPFHMFGTYTVSHGTYGITIQNIIKKNFTFQSGGTIVFGGDPYDAALNLQAVHTVNGVSLSDLNIGSNFASNTVRVNCLMNIKGTPLQPQVDFDLDMPTVNSEENQMIRSLIASEQEMNQQVLYLLGIGRFYTQGANNADAQQYGQTTLAMQSFLSGTVSTQINEVLSQVIKSNDWNFGANISTGDEGWRNAEYEGMVSGRLLNNRLLINGQFGYRDNATTTTPSFIGDFDLQYLLKRNGNLAVKVYNQTNDRYFTRSSLNTQGVGLIMKKDFDGLGDLLRRKKKTKK